MDLEIWPRSIKLTLNFLLIITLTIGGKRFLNLLGKPKLVNEKRNGKDIISLLIEAKTEGERQRFYNTKVKKFLRYNAYRTYTDKKISAVKLVSYDYSNKQLGLKDEDLLQDTDTQRNG